MTEWIKWEGGECPVPADTKVEVQIDCGDSFTDLAGMVRWEHKQYRNIIAYRIVEEHPQGHPHAALMAEYAEVAKTNPEPWKEFEVQASNGSWCELPHYMSFHASTLYRRKPKPPQKKKVRMYQWIRKFDFYFVDAQLYPEGTTPIDAIQRIEPGFEIEVEE